MATKQHQRTKSVLPLLAAVVATLTLVPVASAKDFLHTDKIAHTIRQYQHEQPHAPAILNCSLFDPKQIEIITFDVFAALMDTPESLLATVGSLLPTLNNNQTMQFIDDWITVYGNYFGMTFNNQTQLPQPFPWVIRKGLVFALTNAGLYAQNPQGSPTFEQLALAWSKLTPWDDTLQTLQTLQNAGFKVAALSNGDKQTLTNATNVFLPNLQVDYVFSSDYPVGVFKPNARIYAQVQPYVHYNMEAHLHVAGSSIDALGARSFGIFAALVDEEPMPGVQPCFLIKSLSDLIPILVPAAV